MSTKAAAIQWLEAHVGQDLLTTQVKAGQVVWEPGPRKLAKKGTTQYTLDGSYIAQLGSKYHTVELVDDALSITWQDEAGVVINVTTYSVAPSLTRQTVYGPTPEWHLTCRLCGRHIHAGEEALIEEKGDEYVGAECAEHHTP